jgi:hypothetical protein
MLIATAGSSEAIEPMRRPACLPRHPAVVVSISLDGLKTGGGSEQC